MVLLDLMGGATAGGVRRGLLLAVLLSVPALQAPSQGTSAHLAVVDPQLSTVATTVQSTAGANGAIDVLLRGTGGAPVTGSLGADRLRLWSTLPVCSELSGALLAVSYTHLTLPTKA